jgi:hypothetical protein
VLLTLSLTGIPVSLPPDRNRAEKAMISVDPKFARTYAALAVTQGFQGSPHIDKQNIGPFYGLALGDFDEGTGGIRVECSARVVGMKNHLRSLRSLKCCYV